MKVLAFNCVKTSKTIVIWRGRNKAGEALPMLILCTRFFFNFLNKVYNNNQKMWDNLFYFGIFLFKHSWSIHFQVIFSWRGREGGADVQLLPQCHYFVSLPKQSNKMRPHSSVTSTCLLTVPNFNQSCRSFSGHRGEYHGASWWIASTHRSLSLNEGVNPQGVLDEKYQSVVQKNSACAQRNLILSSNVALFTSKVRKRSLPWGMMDVKGTVWHGCPW